MLALTSELEITQALSGPFYGSVLNVWDSSF